MTRGACDISPKRPADAVHPKSFGGHGCRKASGKIIASCTLRSVPAEAIPGNCAESAPVGIGALDESTTTAEGVPLLMPQ